MTISPQELARRFADADRQVVLLRRATLDMQALRRRLLEERLGESGRSNRDRPSGR